MQRFDDDDQPDTESGVFAMTLQRACEALLAALLQAERLPANVDPDRDRLPRLFLAPVRVNVFSSPARMCSDIGEPPRERPSAAGR